MNDRHGIWTAMVMAAFLSVTAMSPALAAENARPGLRGNGGFAGTLQRQLGLTVEQHEAVRGLLAEQREQQQAIRAKTDERIRALLTPDQKKKFDAYVAQQKQRRQSRN